MSKKKKKKKSFKDQLKIDLIGLLLIFLAIFGSGASAISGGIIPNTLEHIFRFIFGVWYFVASIALLVTGIILIVKKRLPNYKDKRFIGIYFILDRKSTRLNSSHVAISYAVFCLKKKKKQTIN